jgi:hypothetical protein
MMISSPCLQECSCRASLEAVTAPYMQANYAFTDMTSRLFLGYLRTNVWHSVEYDVVGFYIWLRESGHSSIRDLGRLVYFLRGFCTHFLPIYAGVKEQSMCVHMKIQTIVSLGGRSDVILIHVWAITITALAKGETHISRQWQTSSLQNEDPTFMSASDNWLVSCSNLLQILTSCCLYDDTSEDPRWSRTKTRCGAIEEEEMQKNRVSESLGLQTSTSWKLPARFYCIFPLCCFVAYVLHRKRLYLLYIHHYHLNPSSSKQQENERWEGHPIQRHDVLLSHTYYPKQK